MDTIKIGSIRGQDGRIIGLTIGPDGYLIASNGDQVHPSDRPYLSGPQGIAQALIDCEAMWGHGDWDWRPIAMPDVPLPFRGGYA